jgi:hypothetical protein
VKANKRLRQIWDLAEEYGAVQVDEYNDPDTVEREYKFPSDKRQREFLQEVERRGLL